MSEESEPAQPGDTSARRQPVLDYAGVLPPISVPEDGTSAFVFAAFFTFVALGIGALAIALLGGSAFVSALLGSGAGAPPPIDCCGGLALSIMVPLIGGVLVNVTMATLGAYDRRRVVGAQRAFARAGCCYVVLVIGTHGAIAITGAAGPDAQPWLGALAAIVTVTLPAVVAGILLARWGEGRPVPTEPHAAARPLPGFGYRAAGEGESDPWDDLVR